MPYPKAWNLSDENLFFIGREEQLQGIHDFFNKGERRILALTGGSGLQRNLLNNLPMIMSSFGGLMQSKICQLNLKGSPLR